MFSSVFALTSTVSLVLLQIGFLLTPAQAAPDTNLFQWKFSNNALSTSLASCAQFGITVEPVNATNITHGIPPFYMIAWELGGTPRTTLLGLNESSLTYMVDHPIGTQLMLNVVDSQGNGGGVPPSAYTVITGQSTECIVSGNNTDFTVTANVTDTITTCQPWGLRIKGGAPPYNISFAQFNSPIVTNVTVQAPFDAFTYIDRADPGKLLLAAVSDVTGRYAFGTPTVMSQGSADVDCVGLNSTPGNATALDQQAQEASDEKSRKRRTAILAGVLTPILVLLFGGLGIFFYMRRRRARRGIREVDMGPLDVSPKPFMDEAGGYSGVAGQVLSINSFLDQSQSASTSISSSPKSPRSTVVSPSDYQPFQAPAESQNESSSTRALSVSSNNRPGFAGFPHTSVRRPSKALEAGLPSSRSDLDESTRSSTPRPYVLDRSLSAQVSTTPAVDPWPVRSASVGGNPVPSLHGEEEYIIQHRDGGGVVRELPPPYADRSSPANHQDA